MKKKIFGKKLGRDRDSRNALRRDLLYALIDSKGTVTTLAKAKSIQGEVDKIMTLLKKDTIAASRRILSKLDNKRKYLLKLKLEYVWMLKNRTSGFTKIVRLNERKGDNAKMVFLTWVDKIEKTKSKIKEKENENNTTKSK